MRFLNQCEVAALSAAGVVLLIILLALLPPPHGRSATGRGVPHHSGAERYDVERGHLSHEQVARAARRIRRPDACIWTVVLACEILRSGSKRAPSAQRGVRTVATLIIFEMFALSFAMLFYFSYADACLGRQGPQKSICFYDILTVLCFGDIFCELEPEVCFPEPRCKMAVENGLVRPPDEPPQNPALLSDIVHQQYHAHAESDK